MSCEFIKIREVGDKDAMRCSRCGLEISIRRGSVVRASRCRALGKIGMARQHPRNGPGTQLASILRELGIPKNTGCGCDEMIAKTNAWGPDGCEAHREEIIEHLNAAYAALNPSWSDKATIAAKALAMGIVINPFDPAGSLLNAAIRRSRLAPAPADGQ